MITLVTGATGLLGNNVVRLLRERGESVRVLKRRQADARPLADLDVEIYEGDVRDPVAVRQAMAGASRVVHAAALVHIGWSGMQEQQAVNVEGTRHVAAAALEAGARLVHISSVDAIGTGSRQEPADEQTPFDTNIPCPYIVTKRAGERVVGEMVERGLSAVIVNPGFMVGPWDWRPSSGRMLLAVAKGMGVVAPPGVNSYCDPRDVAAGILAAAERGRCGERYILGGETYTFRDAWRIFAEVTGGRRPVISPAGPIVMSVSGWIGDLYGRVTGREPDVNSAATAMSRLPKFYSSARAERELGYTGRPLRESAAAAWDWFQEHGYAGRN